MTMPLTNEERRRCLVYAQAAAHLRAVANVLYEFEPDLARGYSTDAERLYLQALPVIGPAQPNPRLETKGGPA